MRRARGGAPGRAAERAAAGLGLACGLGAAAGLVTGVEALDALSALRLHLLAATLLAAAVLALRGRRRGPAAAAALAVAAAAATPEAFSPGAGAMAAPDAAAAPGGGLRLVSVNAFQWNARPEAAMAALLALDPDLLLVLEPPDAFLAPDSPLRAALPRMLRHETGTLAAGPALFSRRPLSARRAGGGPRRVFARVETPQGPLHLLGLHLEWPVIADQKAEIAALEGMAALRAAPLAVAGDFNAAPWSDSLRRLRAASGARLVSGVGGSYVGGVGGRGGRLPIPFGLPIDHVLATPGLRAGPVARHALPGGDHLALSVRLEVAP